MILALLGDLAAPIILSIPLFLLWGLVVFLQNRKKKKRTNILRYIFTCFFLVSLVAILLQTVSFNFDAYGLHYWGSVNLVPFHEISRMVDNTMNGYAVRYFFENMVGNILLFIPFGLFLPVTFPKIKHWWLMIVFGFSLSILIESAQLFMPGRSTDVDDVILNTFGCMIGVLLYLGCRRIFPKLIARIRA